MFSIKCSGGLPTLALSSSAVHGKKTKVSRTSCLTDSRCRKNSRQQLETSNHLSRHGLQPSLGAAIGGSTLMYLRRNPTCYVSLKDDVGSGSSNLDAGSPASETIATSKLKSCSLQDADKANFSGKSGFVSFYTGSKVEEDDPEWAGIRHRSLLWLLGPMLLVSSVVFPPYAFRVLFEALLEDTVITDFIILFFTELHFYFGVAAFLYVAEMFRGPVEAVASKAVKYTWGYRVTNAITTVLSVGLAITCFGFAWKYTGPAAIAALVPYLSGMAVQLFAEGYTRNKPSIRPLVPIIFQLYRLHQLNRAAQLVAGLIFSMKGVEASAQSVAITSSLQMLLSSMQLLGIFSLWSLASFLMQATVAWHHGKGISMLPF